MLKPFLITSLLALSVTTPAISAAFNGNSFKSTSTVRTNFLPTNIAYRPTGKEQLKRLLRPHSGYLPITQAVRNATGDPNIVVFDNRSPRNGVNSCSYITYRGKRAMVCD